MSDETPKNVEDPKQEDPSKNQDPPKKEDKSAGDDKRKAWSTDDYEHELSKVRGEAAEKRKALSDLQKKLDAHEEEKSKAETDRLKAEGKFKEAAEKAEKDLQDYKKIAEQRAIKAEAKAAAIAAGMNPNAAKFLDTTNVKYDDAGELSGIEEAIAQMKKDLPEVFKKESDTSKDVKPTGSEKDDPPPAKKGTTPTAMATDSKGNFLISDKDLDKAIKEMAKKI